MSRVYSFHIDIKNEKGKLLKSGNFNCKTVAGFAGIERVSNSVLHLMSKKVNDFIRYKNANFIKSPCGVFLKTEKFKTESLNGNFIEYWYQKTIN